MDILNNTTYKSIPKNDAKDRIEVEIGDSKQPDFKPQVKLMRWDNEFNFSVRLITDEQDVKITEEGDKIKWEGKKIDAHFYNIQNEKHSEGAYEFEVILKEKPTTNKIEFTLETKGLDFFYQPELTDKEGQMIIDRIIKSNELHPEWARQIPTLLEAKRLSRPENIVGSYAVYALENKINYVGGKEYKCGKVGHIHRPKVIDSEGNWTWEELKIENELLTITIPQDFLDNAVYPISSKGINFGYESAGGSTNSFLADQGPYNAGWGGKYMGAAGTLTDISVYLLDSDPAPTWGDVGNVPYYFAVYQDGTDGIQVDTTTKTVSSDGWNTATFPATQQTITAQNYWLYCYMEDYGGGLEDYFFYKYDSTGGDGRNVPAAAPWPATLDDDDFYNNTAVKYSIYATYTPSGGDEGTNMQLNISDAWKDVDAIQINISDAWKEVTGAQINISDTWKTIF